MKILTIKSLIIGMVIILMALTPVCAFGQSAAEQYNNGLAQMKKQDYNGAIASFKASMAINKSAANVKKCKQQISKCQKLMKNTTPAPAPVEKKLIIPKSILSAPDSPETEYNIRIETNPESNDWIAKTEGNVNWIDLSKSMDGKELQIRVKPTDKTVIRSAEINVTYENLARKIKVNQKGKKVELTADNLFVKFKKKGGQLLININCNSDTTYTNNLNWYIEKAPEWCNAESTNTTLILKTDVIEKGDPSYKTGRTGDIILRSQDLECTIRIDQK